MKLVLIDNDGNQHLIWENPEDYVGNPAAWPGLQKMITQVVEANDPVFQDNG